jgi:hypothetical protein
MTTKPDGGPAFPELKSSLMRDQAREAHRFTHDYQTTSGMTLRDWLAGQALVGLLASPRGPVDGSVMTDTLAASTAYAVADAMLKERDK